MVQQQDYIPTSLSQEETLPSVALTTCAARGMYGDTFYCPQLSPPQFDCQYDSAFSPHLPVTGSPAIVTHTPQQVDKLKRDFPLPPPVSPRTQQPTPPSYPRMYPPFNGQFDLGPQHAAGASPMAAATHAGPAPDYFVTAGRRTPGPPETYMNIFGVTDAHPAPMTNAGPPYYMDAPQVGSQSSMMVRANTALTLDPHHRELPRTLPSSAGSFNHAPQQMRLARRPMADVQDVSEPSTGTLTPDAMVSPARSPRRIRSTTGSRVAKKKPRSKRQSGSSRKDPTQPDDEHTNCHGQEVPPVLKKSCAEEGRFIFDCRWRYRKNKGEDMWTSIQADFLARFAKSNGKEMLQMKFKRARSKYLEWLPRDEEILRQAWKQMEDERYKTLLDIFIEMGGSKNMRLSPSDIEVKVVNDLKLEQDLYMDSFRDSDIRRRRRVSKKRCRAGADDASTGDEMMAATDLQGTFREDDVIEQAQNRRNSQWHTDSPPSGEVMDNPFWHGNPTPVVASPAIGYIGT